MDLGKLKDVLRTVTKVKELVEPTDELAGQVGSIIDELDAVFAGGLDWSDAPRILGMVVPDLMELVKGFEGKTGAEKRELVVELVWAVYKYFDPDIPWIPEPIESMVEEVVVRKLAEACVEAVWKLWKKDEAQIPTEENAPTEDAGVGPDEAVAGTDKVG